MLWASNEFGNPSSVVVVSRNALAKKEQRDKNVKKYLEVGKTVTLVQLWNFMMGNINILFLLIIAISFGACSKPRSWGDLYAVTVLADSSDWNAVHKVIEECFETRWISPQPEQVLSFSLADPANPQQALNRRNLLVISAGPAEGPTGKMLENLLGADVRDQIQNETGFLYARENAFARDQQLVILAAPTVYSFLRQCADRSSDIRQLFLNHDREEQMEGLYRRMEQVDLADSLQSLYGFHLRMPVDWFSIQDHQDPEFIRFRRLEPDRWITVHWVAGDDSLRHTEAGMRQARDRLGRIYRDKESCEKDIGRFGLSHLGGRSCTLFEGYWTTDAFVGGGPFLLWSWFDPEAGSTGRTYYIDAVVLNPGGFKGPYLHQLRTIANTFQGHVGETIVN